MSTPLWVSQRGVSHLLHFIVDKLDAAQAQGKTLVRTIKLDAKSFPALFHAEFEADKEQYWGYLEQMASQGWFSIKLDRPQAGQAKYECNPRLAVLDETAIRQVAGRISRVKSASELWRESVFSKLTTSDKVREVVVRHKIEIPSRSPDEIITQLNQLPILANEPLLLREVSARLFWGHSKVLDKRQQLVAALLGLEECPFPEMPIQLQVFLPQGGFDGVLFIENQATFEQATRDESGRYLRLALVFASGFKSGAKRLRSKNGASIYFASHGVLSLEDTNKLLLWLRGGMEIPSWFWGDLDFAGMEILATLRQTFPSVEAWKLGYASMLAILKRGGGHEPDVAGKSQQRAIANTGCAFADSELLPALHQTGKFIDQEII